MESGISPAGSSHPLQFTFFNDRGLRAGWRLLIYIAMIVLLVTAVNLVGRQFAGVARGTQPPEFVLRTIQAVVELVLFLVLLLLAWIMSKIEHRNVGTYGLPLQRSLLPAFCAGYFLWGFLPLTVLLLVLRACHVFYFGSLSPLNGQIFAWGLLWLFVFLFVGLFEEYFFRGYALHTLAEGIGFWPASIILAMAFARVHMGNGGETRIGILATAFFALFAATTLWRTGNLWLAVGAHAGWDWGQSFFFGVNDSGFQAPGHLLNPYIQGPD
ncbi:MAG TPA: type II CAAX endopeptidase family protein, partial [Candidatus Sulfotelmatobacter sp.]|nr:type II CAAX endopeptidase family protein [Candidatus Sulfotelmatobacter sp.]